MSEVTVNDWVAEYVTQLFVNRGYDPSADEAAENIVATQWPNWKRLIVKTGLNSDRQLAEDVAFEFASKRVQGGAARIYEFFADYVSGRPQPIREYQEERNLAGEDCDTCGNLGVIMAETSRGQCAFGCRCMNAMKYAGIPKASDDQLRSAWQDRRREADRLRSWALERGIEVDGTIEDFRADFRRWFESAGSAKAMFAKAS
ncbi:hypothetical protein UFOVP184_20 [uncultured Caudovirales phage]|uniref:Uncharacterized protein n=1 Tax=uncultured Caudovirales phage TaxID=2100421 RepID=A0A6J7WFU2_9CAUD|nr:hypothetical protein UFOVP184_20 [uncultured Caudovirales phage]